MCLCQSMILESEINPTLYLTSAKKKDFIFEDCQVMTPSNIVEWMHDITTYHFVPLCSENCSKIYTGHITTGSWKGRGNQYIQFVRVLYCKLPTNGKQLPAFPLEAVPGIELRPQRWEARVLPLSHRDPLQPVIRCQTC